MRILVLISVVIPLCLCYPYPASSSVGAYSYQDSSGRRYGGTYGTGDPAYTNNYISPFGYDFQDFETFIPNFFRNLEQTLQQVMKTTFDPDELQKAPFRIRRPHFKRLRNRFQPFRRFQGFDSDLESPFGMGDNSAFAGSAIGPGFKHQVAAINPKGRMPNIDVMSPASQPRSGSNYYGVSSSSYSRSSNLNGQVSNERGGETIVNDNGMITRYKVDS